MVPTNAGDADVRRGGDDRAYGERARDARAQVHLGQAEIDGPRLQDVQVVAAQENFAAAVARADQARLQAVAQVFTSYWALRTAAQRVTTAANLLASATQSEEVARGRYAEGVGTILDLLSAQNALADARAQAVQSRWTWFSALAQLSRDAGVLGPAGATPLQLSPGAPGSPE